MWNGDLNRPRAKAMNQMIMGMIDVPINNNQHASMDDDVDSGFHGVWAMLQAREQSLFEEVELSQPSKQVRRFESPSHPHLQTSVLEVQLVQLAFHEGHACA